MTAYASTRINSSATPVAPRRAQSHEREALVIAHLYKVRYIADRMAAKLPTSIERDDLYGAGVIGLLDAVERFDARRGIAFTTFAEMRVRGAILDSLRQLDWASRAARRRARAVQTAYRSVEKARGRQATAEEVAAELHITIKNLHEILGEMRALNVSEIDAQTNGDGRGMLESIVDASHSPLEQYEARERRRRLARAVGQLPRRERQVVALYYVEELTMKEIGSRLGVTESRVSQLRAQAISRLRSNLSH